MSRDLLVRHFRQIVLWPVQLMPIRNRKVQGHWELLDEAPECPWSEVVDEFDEDPQAFVQAVDALDAIQTALRAAESAAAPGVPSQPVEELPLSVQRYNCLLALAAGEARKGGDTARAQVLATLALAEATALTVEP